MTNLSKELCEICGIKPKLNCINCPHPCESACNNCSWSRLIYPDFTEPENFVKLFKLITTIENYDYRTGLYYVPQIPSHRQMSQLSAETDYYYSESSDPINAFIACVIQCAKADSDTANYIRETEWVYG